MFVYPLGEGYPVCAGYGEFWSESVCVCLETSKLSELFHEYPDMSRMSSAAEVHFGEFMVINSKYRYRDSTIKILFQTKAKDMKLSSLSLRRFGVYFSVIIVSFVLNNEEVGQ